MTSEAAERSGGTLTTRNLAILLAIGIVVGMIFVLFVFLAPRLIDESGQKDLTREVEVTVTNVIPGESRYDDGPGHWIKYRYTVDRQTFYDSVWVANAYWDKSTFVRGCVDPERPAENALSFHKGLYCDGRNHLATDGSVASTQHR